MNKKALYLTAFKILVGLSIGALIFYLNSSSNSSTSGTPSPANSTTESSTSAASDGLTEPGTTSEDWTHGTSISLGETDPAKEISSTTNGLELGSTTNSDCDTTTEEGA